MADLEFFYTTDSGPGLTTAQPQPSASLGGFVSTTQWTGGVKGDLFGRASTVDIADARADYRCVYVYNPDKTSSVLDVRVYLTAVDAGGSGFAAGSDPRPASFIDALSPQAVAVVSGYSAPAGVSFAAPVNYSGGIKVGDLPAGAGRSVWFRRVPTGVGGTVDVTVEDATGLIVTVRRVVWETETAIVPTTPVDPQEFDPTLELPDPSRIHTPFVRVGVDFLTAGGARVTWELDRAFTDPGPYTFQLQYGRAGTVDAGDWVDVGAPALDAVYLIDPTQRLWSMSPVLFYRVILTSGVATYTSPAAHVFGQLNKRDHLYISELVRKEKLYQRQFVGLNGFLLKARRYGVVCDCVDPVTGEVGNSSHAKCYGTGFVDGYYLPVPLSFVTPDNEAADEKVSYNEGLGTIKPTVLHGRVLASVPINSRDVWLQLGSDERFYVHTIKELVGWQGVPIVYNVEMRQAPRSDIVYQLPIIRPTEPVPDWKTPVQITI